MMTALLTHNDLFRYGPESEAEQVAAGIKQVVLGAAEQMVQSKCWYERGAEASAVSNARSRTGYILDGFFEIVIEGQSQILGPSGSFVIPSGAEYTIRCLEEGLLLSTFSGAAGGCDRLSVARQNSTHKMNERNHRSVSISSKTFD